MPLLLRLGNAAARHAQSGLALLVVAQDPEGIQRNDDAADDQEPDDVGVTAVAVLIQPVAEQDRLDAVDDGQQSYHTDGRTCWVKTGVTIDGLEHIEYLPVMDMRNASIPVERVTSFDVNKAIQRSLTKAAARHGLGLYIYAGEDLPEAEAEQQNGEVTNACNEAAAAADIKQLEAIYHKYEKRFKSNTLFISAVTKRKNELAA